MTGPMKGLLLKECYLMRKGLRAFPLLYAVFFSLSLLTGSEFLSAYPVIMTGLAPVSLLSLDEKSRWHVYCLTLPCTRAQYVSAKYLAGLALELAVCLCCVLLRVIRMLRDGAFDGAALLFFAAYILDIALLSPALTLPLVFRYGVEKGGLFYRLSLGLLVALTMLLPATQLDSLPKQHGLPLLSLLPFAALFALSWLLSIRFYQKREFHV